MLDDSFHGNIFKGCYFVLELDRTEYPFKVKANISSMIIGLGGVISYTITRKCTHVIVNDKLKAQNSYRCQTALKYNIPVVHIDYLNACVNEKKLLQVDNFVILSSKNTKMLAFGKIEVSSKAPVKSSPTFTGTKKDLNFVDFASPPESWKSNLGFEFITYSFFSNTNQTELVIYEVHKNNNEASSSQSYRIFSHKKQSLKDKVTDVKECCYFDDLVVTLSAYSVVCDRLSHLTKQNLSVIPSIGSNILQQRLSNLHRDSSVVPDDVLWFVNTLWKEAIESIESLVYLDHGLFRAEQIDEAEGILLELRDLIKQKDQNQEIYSLSHSLNSLLRCKNSTIINTMKKVSLLSDVCQLIRDFILAGESTNWVANSEIITKYATLRCEVTRLPSDSECYMAVLDMLGDVAINEMCITNIYALRKDIEHDRFNPKRMHNVRNLFHSSRASNYMGILARGLLLPTVVVDDHGGQRTDVGSLGYGIYFAPSPKTSIKYSERNTTNAQRFMLVCSVALGHVHHAKTRDSTLRHAFDGYDSMHAVATSASNPTEFQDDEYVIYDISQQKLEYLVEFSLTSDEGYTVKESLECLVCSPSPVMEEIDPWDAPDILELTSPAPKPTPKHGLISGNEVTIPLKAVHIRAKIYGFAAEVVIIQHYTNCSSTPIEAKYIFPLDDLAAVCGFEAFINDKHIIGEVKEKVTARKQYREAVEEGHGAYLMDQDTDTSNIFTVNVGNLPPLCSAIIKITYVTELQLENDSINFILPASVAPWKETQGLKDVTQESVNTVGIGHDSKKDTTLVISVEMPYRIISIKSPSHKIMKKSTETKAVVSLSHDQTLAKGFQLLIALAEINVPRMWVETHPEDPSHQACMLTFYPEFHIKAKSANQIEVIFIVDQSNSMKGQSIKDAMSLLALFLHFLPTKIIFNVLVFGTGYDELFPVSKPKSTKTTKMAADFIKKQNQYLGSTNAYYPLSAIFKQTKVSSHLTNIILISDGHLSDTDAVASLVRSYSETCRLFTAATGDSADCYRLRTLANLGAGTFEQFTATSKSQWKEKVMDILVKTQQPCLTEMGVEWQVFDGQRVQQAPQTIMSLFQGSRQIIYGFVANCNMARLKAKVNGEEVTATVYSSQLASTTGLTLHRLTAKGLIKDWEDGNLADNKACHEAIKLRNKNNIINTSTKYSVLSKFTSFVAIEKRSEDEIVMDSQTIPEILSKESVDFLPLMGWEGNEISEGRSMISRSPMPIYCDTMMTDASKSSGDVTIYSDNVISRARPADSMDRAAISHARAMSEDTYDCYASEIKTLIHPDHSSMDYCYDGVPEVYFDLSSPTYDVTSVEGMVAGFSSGKRYIKDDFTSKASEPLYSEDASSSSEDDMGFGLFDDEYIQPNKDIAEEVKVEEGQRVQESIQYFHEPSANTQEAHFGIAFRNEIEDEEWTSSDDKDSISPPGIETNLLPCQHPGEIGQPESLHHSLQTNTNIATFSPIPDSNLVTPQIMRSADFSIASSWKLSSAFEPNSRMLKIPPSAASTQPFAELPSAAHASTSQPTIFPSATISPPQPVLPFHFHAEQISKPVDFPPLPWEDVTDTPGPPPPVPPLAPRPSMGQRLGLDMMRIPQQPIKMTPALPLTSLGSPGSDRRSRPLLPTRACRSDDTQISVLSAPHPGFGSSQTSVVSEAEPASLSQTSLFGSPTPSYLQDETYVCIESQSSETFGPLPPPVYGTSDILHRALLSRRLEVQPEKKSKMFKSVGFAQAEPCFSKYKDGATESAETIPISWRLESSIKRKTHGSLQPIKNALPENILPLTMTFKAGGTDHTSLFSVSTDQQSSSSEKRNLPSLRPADAVQPHEKRDTDVVTIKKKKSRPAAVMTNALSIDSPEVPLKHKGKRVHQKPTGKVVFEEQLSCTDATSSVCESYQDEHVHIGLSKLDGPEESISQGVLFQANYEDLEDHTKIFEDAMDVEITDSLREVESIIANLSPNINLRRLKAILIEAGLRSSGFATFIAVLNLLHVYLASILLCHKQNPEKFPLMLPPTQRVSDSFASLLITDAKGIDLCKDLEEICGGMYNTLELGRSWAHVLAFLMGPLFVTVE